MNKIKKANWKFPFNLYNFDKTIEKEKIFKRNITLTTSYLNKSLKCHKGKVIGKLLVNKQHLGFKLGSFFITKVLGERIAYRKRQKLLLKRSKQKQIKKK
jgi:ribosomal protein S19